jgi:biopolymer transport protein ExbD
MAKFKPDVGVESKVPTGSMADIAFLLLIFFMVTTIFRQETGLEVTLPRATQGLKLDRQNLSAIWIDRNRRISIDDALVSVGMIEAIMAKKASENPQLVVAFKTDQDAPYYVMHDVMEQLKLALATNVSFNHDPKLSGGGGS